jgi:hypothetical protein
LATNTPAGICSNSAASRLSAMSWSAPRHPRITHSCATTGEGENRRKPDASTPENDDWHNASVVSAGTVGRRSSTRKNYISIIENHGEWGEPTSKATWSWYISTAISNSIARARLHVRGYERMQGTQRGLEEPCTAEVVCTVRWGGEHRDALSLLSCPQRSSQVAMLGSSGFCWAATQARLNSAGVR